MKIKFPDISELNSTFHFKLFFKLLTIYFYEILKLKLGSSIFILKPMNVAFYYLTDNYHIFYFQVLTTKLVDLIMC